MGSWELTSKLILVVIGMTSATGLVLPSAIAAMLAEPNTVNSEAIIDGQVKKADIGFNAVTYSKILRNSIDSSKIIDESVKLPDLASNSVDSSKISDGAVTPPKLADGITAISKVAGPASTITLSSTLQDIVSTSVLISTDSEIALVLDMTLESGGFTIQSGTVQIALSSTGSADLTVVGGDTIPWSSDTSVPPHHIVIATNVSPTGETVTITVRANDTSPSGPTDTFVPANETHLLVIALPS
jgi:hypothetical protein